MAIELVPDEIQFAENPEPRCLCVLVVDASSSMKGDKVEQLNSGIAAFAQELKGDRLASPRTEIAIVTFKGVSEMAQGFVTANQFYPQRLNADEGIVIEEDQFYSESLYVGDGIKETLPPDYVTEDGLFCYKAPFRLLGGTKTSEGISLALDEIERRKQMYRDYGIEYYRPWLFLIIAGEATEHNEVVEAMTRRLKDTDSQERVAAFSVGIEGANMDMLARISPRRPLLLKGLDFSSMFLWLSRSMTRVSHSRIDDEIFLDTDGLKTWAAI